MKMKMKKISIEMTIDRRAMILRGCIDRVIFSPDPVVGLWAISHTAMYIEGRNYSFSTVPVLFNKCFSPRTPYRVGGLAGDVMRVGKPFCGKSLDL